MIRYWLSVNFAILLNRLFYRMTKPMAELDNKGQVIKRSTGPWGFNNRIMKNGRLYMSRSWIGRLRLHIFFMGDEDRDPHDHPWGFWTFPFRDYVEEVTEKYMPAGGDENGLPEYATKLQVVRAWRFNYRPAEHMHRVLGVYAGKVILTSKTARFDHKVTAADLVAFDHIYKRRGYKIEPMWEPIDGGKLITIVIRGGFTRRWGFLRNRDGKWCWQDFKEYLTQNGKDDAPCQ